MNANKKRDNPSPNHRGWRSGDNRDITYSFILRMRLDPAADGEKLRPQFRLEDVSDGREKRFTDFESVVECLGRRIREILQNLNDNNPSRAI